MVRDNTKIGPGRGELRMRIAVSIGGLALLGLAVGVRGIDGPAALEVIALATLFFGATAIWSAWALWRH